MKRLISITIASLFVAAGAHAGSIRDNCGCGIGTMALGDQDPTVLSQLAATALNGIGSQSLGITSGTLECDPASAVVSNKRVIEYVADNMDHLAHDMAMGDGASMNALADLMDVSDGDRSGIFAQLQQGFDRIFTSENVTAEQVVSNISGVLKS
jgi:hypothetical protein